MFNKYTASKLTVFVLMLAVILFVSCKKNNDVKDNPPVVEIPVIINDATKVTASVTVLYVPEVTAALATGWLFSSITEPVTEADTLVASLVITGVSTVGGLSFTSSFFLQPTNRVTASIKTNTVNFEAEYLLNIITWFCIVIEKEN